MAVVMVTPAYRYCENPVSPFDMPEFRSRFLPANDAIQTVRPHFGGGINPLPLATHELRFFASFFLGWPQDGQQRTVITSNTIILTVQ